MVRRLYRDFKKDMFFSTMIGTDENSIIQEKMDLSKDKGDNVTFGLRMRITDAGQTSGTTGITLEGNEVALSFYDFAVPLVEKGQSVKAQSKLTLKRTAFNLRTEMKSSLQDWASEATEVYMLNKMLASPSTNRYFDETTGTMTVKSIEKLVRQAKLATPTIRQVTIKGKKYYVILAHGYALKGLKNDDDFINYNKDARARGADNPLIQGADYIIDGALIYEYNRPELLMTGNKVRTLLLGAQAGALAWGQKPAWYEKDFDYDRVPGVATDMLIGFEKTKFNSEDYGVLALDNAYTED
jgi:N4-gp56 family major capsid protein